MTKKNAGEHGPSPFKFRLHVSRCTGVFFATLIALALTSQSARADVWAGRTLNEILTELRASGLSLIYSNQVVTPELRVIEEPQSSQPIDRLREVLKQLGLTLKSVGRANAGYAIVRDESRAHELSTTHASVSGAELEEVKVYASRFNVRRDDSVNAVAVAHSALERITGSEQDALRALHYLPGTANNGASALTHVRGGNEDETLVQFDGVELYNPVHLKDFQGLFGLLDGEFVQSLQFFSGGYPVRYGNHTSGMVDIEARHTETTNNLLGVSMLYTRAITSGSFADNQGTWLFGYRNSSLPEVLSHLQKKIGDPQFEDFVGRLSYDWHGTKFTAGALRLNDELSLFTMAHEEQTVARYHDTYLWFRAEQDWSERVTSRLQFSRAILDSDRDGSVDIPLISNGTIARTRETSVNTLQMDWSTSAGDTAGFDWGARIDRGKLDYDYRTRVVSLNPLARTFHVFNFVALHLADSPRGDLYSAYASARDNFGNLSGEFGVRWDDYDYIDQAKVLSPRLNLRYAINDNNNVQFSAGRFVQARSPNALDITSLTSVLQGFNTPESSRQFVLAFEHRFEPSILMRMEAYTKHNDHVRQYSENIMDIVTLAPELKIDRTGVIPQSSAAHGIELSVQSAQQGPFNWWANYTWSTVYDRIRGHDYPRSFDQPQAFAAGFAWIDDRWQNSAAFTWHTGWPNTPITITHTNGDDIATLGPRNSARFGDYSSLDLRSQYQVPIGKTVLQMYIELHNALNRANDCCRQLSVTQQPNGTLLISVRQKSWLSLVPLAGIDYRF